MNLQKLGGRRFLLALLAWAGTTVLQWYAKLDAAGTAYGLTIAATVAAYITGNVAEGRESPDMKGKKE